MLRVGHFIDTHESGGAERVMVDICTRLAEHGFDPLLLHFGNDWLVAQCERHGLEHALVPGERFYRSKASTPRFITGFARWLKEHPLDLLHTHLYGPLTTLAYAAAWRGIPLVGTMHDTYTIEEKPKRFRWVEAASLLGSQVVTVCDSMNRYFNVQSRWSKRGFTTIYNGVDVNLFDGERDEAMRSRLGLRPEDVMVITVGRLVEIKAHDVLIRAVAAMPLKERVQVFIVGDGPRHEYLERRIEELRLATRVRLLGYRDDIPSLLQAADVFVLPSHSEGLSCSVIEAMAAGLPSIVTDVGGNRELISNGRTGYLIAPADAGGLAGKLQMLVKDDAQRRRLGAAAREVARKRFALETMVKNYATFYREAIAMRARPQEASEEVGT